VDITKKNANNGETILHQATKREHVGVILSLVRCDQNLLNIVDHDNYTPLAQAILLESYFGAHCLIYNGANANFGAGIYVLNYIFFF